MKYLTSFVVIANLACAVLAMPECAVPCSPQYTPVCGSDGEHFKVFTNKCFLRREHCMDGHNWSQRRMEECTSELEQEKGCESRCTRVYIPVCGTDGSTHKVFPNKCALDNAHCKDGHTWFQTRMEECSSKSELVQEQGCESRCTRVYIPVCGTDGSTYKVFPNKCVLDNAHCKDGHTWLQTRMEECSSKSEFEQGQGCETPCTRVYLPVCGTDGSKHKVFPNKCVLENAHCKDGHTWFQTRMEECPSKSELEQKQGCETPCTRVYIPVCGTDGSTNKVFPNKCVLDNAHCKDGHTWFQTRMEECSSKSELEQEQECETPCTRVYIPVCGTDGSTNKVFPNKCVLENAHCKDGHTWFQTRMEECSSKSELEQEQGCETPCTRVYIPVCGTDGSTNKVFPNKCVLDNAHCKDGHTWFQTRMDECAEQSKLEQPEICEIACTREYTPVCGTDGLQHKIFPNQCRLNNEHCKDGHNWFQTRMTVCATRTEVAKDCEVPCTREYRPVCGSDGENHKVFPNICILSNHICKDGHYWFQTRMDECGLQSELEQEESCEIACTREYTPVCGTDGVQHKIFPNQCVLNNEHCKDGHNWFQTRMTVCEVHPEDAKDCEVPCSQEYKPVCGSYADVHKMFRNACVMNNQHCKDGHDWFQTDMDVCTDHWLNKWH